jgi:hypothetical protein
MKSASQGNSRVYQFKIVLDGIRPLIWRRIQVPGIYSFWDLHVAIQDAMGWQDYHLHRFEIPDPLSGVGTTIVSFPTEASKQNSKLLSGWKVKMDHYFTMANNKAWYTYDYLSDNWNHRLTLEGIFPREAGIGYPLCLDGRRACPPEDCGGVRGYYRLLGSLDRQAQEHKLRFTAGAYDPERLNIREINFDNPTRRLNLSFNR